MLYFCRRGRENERNMVKEDIVSGNAANGLEYIALRERATKDHPGGLRDNEDNSQDVMCEWPDNPKRCPVRCIKKCLQKRNPNRPASLMAKVKKLKLQQILWIESDAVWYVQQYPFGEKHSGQFTRPQKSWYVHSLHIALFSGDISSHLQRSRPGEFDSKKCHWPEKWCLNRVIPESYHERPTIQQQVQSSAIVSNFVAPVRASVN